MFPTCILHQVVPRGEGWPRLRPLEEVGVVAALAQLHGDVEEAGALPPAVHHIDVLLEEGAVQLLLHLAHAHLQNGLLLGGEAPLHVRLQAAEEEGAEDLEGRRGVDEMVDSF